MAWTLKEQLKDALAPQVLYRATAEPEVWDPLDLADRKLEAPRLPEPPEGVTINALGFASDVERADTRRFRAPLTRVGPVRSGSLREFEELDP